MENADVVIVGAGLSGLVAATELTRRGKRVVVVDAEPSASLGGQAWWSFGGLFLVNSPEQQRLGVKDSADLAFSDWCGSAQFSLGAERGQGPDRYGYEWAKKYVEFAAGPMREWLHSRGVRWFPLVQWAERGGYLAGGHGNTVPRFHVTWGTGPGILAPFISAANHARDKGLLRFFFRHRVTQLLTTNGVVNGVKADILAPDEAPRGAPSNRDVVGSREILADSVIIASGGIGADHERVRSLWGSGMLPRHMLSGVPDSTDGSMLPIAEKAGAHLTHLNRMWHYPEGIPMHTPIWSNHGIRILPGPSSLWLDADGQRLPAPLFPGFDALGALEHVTSRGDEYSWFVLNKKIMESEFALSGSDMNPDLTGKDIPLLLQRVLPGAVGPVEKFANESPEFLWADSPTELAEKMNHLTGEGRIDAVHLAHVIRERDQQVTSGLGKDPQVVATTAARNFRVDKWMRVSPPAPLVKKENGPLLAVRLRVLTRKTLGGIHTNGSAAALSGDGNIIPGLYAVGEAAGFGGGGVHGVRALEGTFLGGCIHSGKVAAESIA